VTGGGSRNRAWRQLCADIFNVEVVTLRESEGAAFGAALQAIWVHKLFRGEKTAISDITNKLVKVDEVNRVSPNQGNVQIYMKKQEYFDKLTNNLRNFLVNHLSF
jgi:xylulokinase